VVASIAWRPNGAPEWLTLPLAYHPRDVLIRNLRFANNARKHFDERVARFPWIHIATWPNAGLIRNFLYRLDVQVEQITQPSKEFDLDTFFVRQQLV
jgi:hypothetical protein